MEGCFLAGFLGIVRLSRFECLGKIWIWILLQQTRIQIWIRIVYYIPIYTITQKVEKRRVWAFFGRDRGSLSLCLDCLVFNVYIGEKLIVKWVIWTCVMHSNDSTNTNSHRHRSKVPLHTYQYSFSERYTMQKQYTSRPTWHSEQYTIRDSNLSHLKIWIPHRIQNFYKQSIQISQNGPYQANRKKIHRRKSSP